jgi:uncharacterized protein
MVTDLLQNLRGSLPLWDLFEHLQSQGLSLTIDQYDLLRQSIRLGYITTWEDVREVCMLLWIKPSESNQQQKIFDEGFAAYQNSRMPKTSTEFSKSEDLTIKQVTNISLIMPQLPLRPTYQHEQSDREALGAVQINPNQESISSDKWKFTLSNLPISKNAAKQSWEAWQEPQQQLWQQEIDVDQTIAQINPSGWIETIAWHRDLDQKSELIVLVDSGDNMQTYLPAMKDLFHEIENGQIRPAQIYRFIGDPQNILSHWKYPHKSLVSESVLKNLYSMQQAIVLVISDAGAAIGSYDDDLVQGILTFLDRWEKCVRQVLWLNPVPIERWVGTPAAEVQRRLDGRMLTPEQFDRLAMRRLMQLGSWQK